jgi:spoIIIJ-associated protein
MVEPEGRVNEDHLPDDVLEDDADIDGEDAVDTVEGDETLEIAEDDETDFATVATGPTVEDARRTAVEQLRKLVPSVTEADVEFVVLEEGSRGGFFGRGKMLAQVEAHVRPSAAQAAPALDDDGPRAGERLGEFIEQVLSLMGIDASVETSETAEGVRADISGDDLGLLIGRHGSTIDALQYIAAIVVNGDRRQRRQVVVDAEGYRVRRESILRALAERTAQRVARDNSPITLKPMSAAERKVIHLCLKDHPRVETVSEGNEPFRAVVVSPRRKT